MPRNSGTGVYAPPPGITAVPNTPIESADWNSLVADLVGALNAAWPIGLGGTGGSSGPSALSSLGALPLAGGTMTGALTLNGSATANLHAVTKLQMDTELAGKSALVHTHTSASITDFSTAVGTVIAATSINALSDVTITSPVNKQILKYNGTAWVNAGFTTEYDKGTLAQNTTYTQAHGLGAHPSLFQADIECTAADAGYAVGDRIPTYLLQVAPYEIGFVTDTTNVSLITRFSTSFRALNKSTRVEQVLTPSSWKVIFKVIS